MKGNDQDKKWLSKSLAIFPGLMSGALAFLYLCITDNPYEHTLLDIISEFAAMFCLAASFYILFINIVQQQKQIDRLKLLVKDNEKGTIDQESLASS